MVKDFAYNEATETLTVPHLIRGKLFEGDVEAYRLVYRTALDAYTVGPITWKGDLSHLAMASEKKGLLTIKGDLPKTPPSSKKRTGGRRWTIKAEGASRPPGDIETWTKAEATDGEVIIRADKLERNIKTDVIIASGNVRYFSKDMNALCEKVTVFRNEKRAIIEGDIQATVKPEENAKLEAVEITPIRPVVPPEIAQKRPTPPKRTLEDRRLDSEVHSAASRRKYPILIWAQRVEYWYAKGQRRAIIKGSPQAHQELTKGRWRHIWTHAAYYDGEKETLKLVSSAEKKDTRVRTSLGDDMLAKWFQISTREGDDTWSGEGIEGDVFVDQEETEEPESSQIPSSLDQASPSQKP
jgi:hypothetical protein